MTEVIVFGAIVVYLLALIPAAVICCRKRQWAMFFAGWLTFGLVWCIGAASGESRRTLGRAAVAIVAAVLVVGVAYSRPAPVLGVNGASLGRSVSTRLLPGDGECRHLSAAEWSCPRWDSAASGDVIYRVHVNRMGCWHGVESDVPAKFRHDQIVGCVHLDDYL